MLAFKLSYFVLINVLIMCSVGTWVLVMCATKVKHHCASFEKEKCNYWAEKNINFPYTSAMSGMVMPEFRYKNCLFLNVNVSMLHFAQKKTQNKLCTWLSFKLRWIKEKKKVFSFFFHVLPSNTSCTVFISLLSKTVYNLPFILTHVLTHQWWRSYYARRWAHHREQLVFSVLFKDTSICGHEEPG